MKRFTLLSLLAGVALLLVMTTGCKKKNTIPEVSTYAVTEITQTTANAGGNVTSDGGSEVTVRGVCWNTSPNPTVNNFKTENGSGAGTFTVSLSHLSFNTTYFLRAYATNGEGTAYGSPVVFVTAGTGFHIGQLYGGGIVFYLDYSGEHGMICAEADQDKVFWANESRETGAVETEIGTGQANTTKIVALLKPLNIPSAAQICDDLELNGYSDWFLPAKEELTQMYANLVPLGLGNFGWSTYWSSSETAAANAWCENFRVGEHHDWNKNTSTYYVRAVRVF